MKIAILLFGQARFINQTFTHILEDIDLPKATVDYFGHFWEKVGYIPDDDIESTCDHIPNIKKLLPFKRITIENNIGIDTLGKSMQILNKACNCNIPWPGDIGEMRYYIGQHYSTAQCYKDIMQYEAENDFKYDIIIKTRTDVVYKNRKCYADEKEYNKIKTNKYLNFKTDIPHIKCSAMRILNYNKSDEHDIKIFYKKKYTTTSNETKLSNLSYKRRLAISDWCLIANRQAAELFYNNWFIAMLGSWRNDLLYKKQHPEQKWLIRSEQCLQGEIIYNNNIYAEHIERLETKIYNPDRLKPGLTVRGLINSKEDIQEQLRRRFKYL